MAHGKTLDLIAFARQMGNRAPLDRPARERDRSLRGKARRRARKAANR